MFTVCVCMYVCMYVRMYTYIHTYIKTHDSELRGQEEAAVRNK